MQPWHLLSSLKQDYLPAIILFSTPPKRSKQITPVMKIHSNKKYILFQYYTFLQYMLSILLYQSWWKIQFIFSSNPYFSLIYWVLEAATRISTLSPSPFTAIIHTLLNDPTQSLKIAIKRKVIIFYRKEQTTDIYI